MSINQLMPTIYLIAVIEVIDSMDEDVKLLMEARRRADNKAQRIINEIKSQAHSSIPETKLQLRNEHFFSKYKRVCQLLKSILS